MAVKLWGPMLTGIAQGFGDYQKGQEDLAYTRQARVQDLRKGQLANQAQEMQNTAAQQALQNADLTHKYWVDATQPDSAPPAQQGQAAAAQAAPATAPQPQSSFKPSGPLSMDQLAALDKQNQMPLGTSYGVMMAESAGKEDAQGPVLPNGERAQGLFQVRQSTADSPGYGLKPFSPKDPAGAMGYLGAMFKQAGGDPSKALAYYNAGPKGNPDNPQTKAYIPKVQSAAQQFAAAYQLDQAKQQPTPAQQIQARDAAGVATPAPVYQQAAQAQGQQIQTMMRAGQAAQKDGHPELAQQFFEQAQKLQTQQQTLQEKAFKTQKDANEETAKLAVGVKDQGSYDNWRSQVAQNPAMQSAVTGLGLTGDYNQDRNKIQTLADRTETLASQHNDALKQKEFELKQQVAQRKQQQQDQVKVQYEQVQLADENRRQALQQKGMPFTPSLQASLPPGTPPAVAQKAQKAVQDAQIKYQANNMASLQAARQTQSIASGLLGILDAKAGPLETGGLLSRFVPGYANFKASGNSQQAVAAQEFDKNANQLVTQAQIALKTAGATGPGAFTSAMFDRLQTQKPERAKLSATANRDVATEYYNVAATLANKATFMNEYMQANPGAIPQTGELAYAAYEQTLGPSVYDDPDAPMGYRLNTAAVPKLPDGRKNPDYKDYHEFFKQGYYAPQPSNGSGINVTAAPQQPQEQQQTETQ